MSLFLASGSSLKLAESLQCIYRDLSSQVVQDFVSAWDDMAGGLITFADFLDYYEDLGAKDQ